MRRSIAPDAFFQNFGFSMCNRHAEVMPKPHRHSEIEMTVLEVGWIDYLFGGTRIRVPAQTLCVRWASVPHQSVAFEEGGVHYALRIPVAWFMVWDVPHRLLRALLAGELLLDRELHPGCSDWALFDRWFQTFQGNTPEHHRVILLEAQARLQRLALRLKEGGDAGPETPVPRGSLGSVERMAAFIAENYTRPIHVEDVARSAGLHPNSAMRLFRRSCGRTLLEYLTLHRVWHAQRLLAASGLKIRDVAEASGFGSVSRFYAAFQRFVGQHPSEYAAGLPVRTS
ncbi:MAG: Melibiose operon regulatory protein [Verrucomicrobiota bacterium]|jgi:AraC-like DNA-binding protein